MPEKTKEPLHLDEGTLDVRKVGNNIHVYGLCAEKKLEFLVRFDQMGKLLTAEAKLNGKDKSFAELNGARTLSYLMPDLGDFAAMAKDKKCVAYITDADKKTHGYENQLTYEAHQERASQAKPASRTSSGSPSKSSSVESAEARVVATKPRSTAGRRGSGTPSFM